MERTAARAWLAFGLLAISAHLVVGREEWVLYHTVGIATITVTAAAIVRRRPPNLDAWLVLIASEILFVAGDVGYDTGASTFPGIADAFYLPAYAAWIAAAFLFVRREIARRDVGTHIDAMIVVGSLGLALWTVFVDEQLASVGVAARVVSLAYPIADLVLVALMLRLVFSGGRRTPAFWWLFASVAVMPVADAAYVVPSVETVSQYGTWMDALWLFSYVALARAALDPTCGRMTVREGTEADATVTIRRFWVLGASISAVPLAAIASDLWHGYVDVLVVSCGTAAIAAVLTWRIVLVLRQLYETRDRLSESERRFRMVFERAPIGISVGRDGMLSETNPKLHEMLGYTADELARMHYTEITHPDDRLLDVQVELDNGDRDSFAVDKRYVAKSGAVREAHVHIALDVHDGLGISLVEDVTERNALQERLRQAQKMEAIGKLAGGVAHDFNNLMTAVLGYSELLLARLEPGDPNRQKIEAIRDSAVRASELTRQLLAFGRRQMLQTAEIDLREVVGGMEELLGRLVGDGVRLETAYGAEPVVVFADPTQIEQVVTNLAVNARDAMPAGGTLTIVVVSDGHDAVLSVADTGEGIDAGTAARIFEPFFTTKPQGEGSGLGLSTVHGIVGQSGGTVEVESEPGRGALFVVRLPLVRRDPVLPELEPAATLVD